MDSDMAQVASGNPAGGEERASTKDIDEAVKGAATLEDT